jgi:hypothetical protein
MILQQIGATWPPLVAMLFAISLPKKPDRIRNKDRLRSQHTTSSGKGVARRVPRPQRAQHLIGGDGWRCPTGEHPTQRQRQHEYRFHAGLLSAPADPRVSGISSSSHR